MKVTSKGRELAGKLLPSIGMTHEIGLICSSICRLATEYCRLQEQACNGYQDARGNWDERATLRAEAKEDKIEKQIRALCERLPLVDGKPIQPDFGGDPRGATVKLVMPDGRYDDWGKEGICVPGS